MYANRGRIAVAAVSGIAIAYALAGCSGLTHESALRHAKPKTASAATDAPTATPTPTPTPTPTVTPTHKATHKAAPPVVHHAAPPKPKPKPKPVTYADGAYTADGQYVSPGGPEEIEVDITLASGKVTAVSVKTVHADSTAASYETEFSNGISAVVVGRSISGLSVGAVGGSSLTAEGFNQALSIIRAQAKH